MGWPKNYSAKYNLFHNSKKPASIETYAEFKMDLAEFKKITKSYPDVNGKKSYLE